VPMYDRVCRACGEQFDRLEPITPPDVACPKCGSPTERAWCSKAPGAIPDNVPGGIHVSNALCHEDGSPRRFDSKSEMHRYAKEHGWTNYVQHQGGKGGDKSKHTSRWI
jgi:putative FmdB family regulatory protein